MYRKWSELKKKMYNYLETICSFLGFVKKYQKKDNFHTSRFEFLKLPNELLSQLFS